MTTYLSSELSNLRNANKDYLVVSIVSGEPSLYFQDNGIIGFIKFATRISDGQSMYLKDLGGDSYEFISYTNVTNVGFYHIEPEFDAWLDANGSHMFSGQNITLSNGTFSNFYIAKKPGHNYTVGGYKNFYTSLDQWTPPIINSFSSYLDGIREYVVNGNDFSNLRSANEDIILISVVADIPQLVFQDNTVDGQVGGYE